MATREGALQAAALKGSEFPDPCLDGSGDELETRGWLTGMLWKVRRFFSAIFIFLTSAILVPPAPLNAQCAGSDFIFSESLVGTVTSEAFCSSAGAFCEIPALDAGPFISWQTNPVIPKRKNAPSTLSSSSSFREISRMALVLRLGSFGSTASKFRRVLLRHCLAVQTSTRSAGYRVRRFWEIFPKPGFLFLG